MAYLPYFFPVLESPLAATNNKIKNQSVVHKKKKVFIANILKTIEPETLKITSSENL